MAEFASNELNRILTEEIAAGNRITERSEWPPKAKRLVILSRRFHKPYEVDEAIVFTLIDDSHYWYAEYRDKATWECLACR